MLRKMKNAILQMAFPRICPVCGEILTENNRDRLNPYICSYCRRHLMYVTEPYCIRCGKPLEADDEAYCSSCDERQRIFDEGRSVIIHDDNAKKILYGLKYSNKKDNADAAGREAALRLGSKICSWNPEVIVPVPLHKSRQRHRGFNQAEILARRLSENIGLLYERRLPVDEDYLFRVKKTEPQKELGTEDRAKNVAGKFKVNDDAEPYKRVLLLDDIFTSGATVNECAKVLKQSGAKEVFFLTISTVG